MFVSYQQCWPQKIIIEMIENYSEFSWCWNSCNKLLSSRSWQAMKLPMILLWKAVVFEVGVQGLQAHPQKFWVTENLGKNPENPCKNSAQRCLTSRNGAEGLHKNTWRPFFGGYTKKRSSHDLCGRKFVGKSCTKNFSDKFGEIRAESFAPKNLPAPTPMMKRHLRPHCSFFERAEGEMPSPFPAALCILFHTYSRYSLL